MRQWLGERRIDDDLGWRFARQRHNRRRSADFPRALPTATDAAVNAVPAIRVWRTRSGQSFAFRDVPAVVADAFGVRRGDP